MDARDSLPLAAGRWYAPLSGLSQRWERPPNLFLIGAPKSGTTSLYEYLRPHPQIFLSAVKEPHYFAADMQMRRAEFVYGKDQARYADLFKDAGGAKRIGEASTGYLFSREAPNLVRAVQPRPWIIVMLRNPIDFMHSLHAHRVAGKADEIDDFARALDADLLPDFGGPVRAARHRRNGTYRERARYAEQLQRWIEVFGRDRLHVVIFEEFVADTARHYREVLDFLEVASDFQPPSFSVHNPRHTRPTLAGRVLIRNRASAWVLKTALPSVIGYERAEGVRTRIKHSAIVRPPVTTRPPLPADLRKRLEEEFKDDVARVGDVIGRDLVSFWFTSQTVSAQPYSAGRIS